MTAPSSIGRRLVGTAVLWQDWDQEAGEGTVRYWELFTDLLMVAAASAIADNLQEEQSMEGFGEFALLYFAIVNGWLLYTHHYTSRFEETSLMHSFVLFFFLLGMAVAIVNASYHTARLFSLGIVLQRVSFLCMIIPIGFYLIRARAFLVAMGSVTLVTTSCFVLSALRPDWAVYCWTAAAIIDYSTESFLTWVLPGTKLIPINIEHTKDRLGVLVLVMLGETVISSTITYREYAADSSIQEGTQYYIVLSLSFLLIFMFTLIFFNMQPAPRDHALRRSRLAGTLVLVLNKTLGLSLLSVGVSIKLAVKAVAENDALSRFASALLGLAVGISMMILFGMRCCHYAGRLPRPNDPPDVRLLMWIWWAVFAVFSVIPFFFVWATSPMTALALYSSLLLILCVVESWFTHVLEKHLPNGDTEAPHGNQEARPLISEHGMYDSVAKEMGIDYHGGGR